MYSKMDEQVVLQIKQKINEIEADGEVEVLFAVESGSRAWGFASPDSDYDVRFVYKHKAAFYLQLGKRRDVIEYQLDDVFDISGWDLDKTLRLLHTSNPTLFEWVNSPIIYKTTPFHQFFKKEVKKYFLQRAGLFHYLSMAEGNYREYLKGETVKLKKYFYVIRPLLACRWILSRNCPPPMLFSELVEACLEHELIGEIDNLFKWKMSQLESETGKRIDILNDWIEQNLTAIRESACLLPKDQKEDWQDLNEIFLSEVLK